MTKKPLPIFGVNAPQRLNEIMTAHEQQRYLGEGHSALRDLRDAEGAAAHRFSDQNLFKIRVGRQWLDQSLKDTAVLIDVVNAQAKAINLQEKSFVRLSDAFSAVTDENRQLKARLQKIPGWILRLFGVS